MLRAEHYLVHTSVKQDPHVVRVSSCKQVGCCVAVAICVEDGATNLGPRNMVIGVPIERGYTCFNKPIPQCGLPRRDLRPLDNLILYPRVGLIHQVFFPANILHEAVVPINTREKNDDAQP